jgi:hypothetical protein
MTTLLSLLSVVLYVILYFAVGEERLEVIPKWTILGLLALFTLLDHDSTRRLMKRFGIEGEQNPLIRWFCRRYGIGMGLALHGLVVVPAIALPLYFFFPHSIFLAITATLGVVVALNYRQLR